MATDIAATPETAAPAIDSTEYLFANPIPAQIPNGPFHADPSPMSDAHNNGAPYKIFLSDTEVVYESGLDVAPVAGDGTEPGLEYRFHNGRGTKIVKGSAERTNAKPVVPHPDTSDPNEVLVKADVQFANPLVIPGGLVYSASWLYIYRLKKPKHPDRSFYPTGTSPAETRTSAQNYYGPSDFSKALLDSSFAPETNAVAFPEGTPPRLPLETPPDNSGYPVTT